jgi:excisionase family DNA binding protein
MFARPNGEKSMAPASIPPPNKLITVPDAAERLCVSPRKIWRMVATGELKSVRVGLRGTRIPENALANFISRLPEAR